MRVMTKPLRERTHFTHIISHLDPHWPHTFSISQTEHWVMGRQNRLHACFTGLVMGVAFRFFIWFFEHSFPFLTQLEIRRRQLDHRILQLEKSSWNSGIEGSSIVLWGPPLGSDLLGFSLNSSMPTDYISWALASWKLLGWISPTFPI